MPSSPSSDERTTLLEIARQLSMAAAYDTVFRDHFLARAREHLARVLPEVRYRGFATSAARIEALVAESRRLVERQDWTRVKAIADQVARLRQALAAGGEETALAREIYDAADVAVDPFCPDLQPLLVDPPTAAAARDALLRAFTALQKVDPERSELYRARHVFFRDLRTLEAKPAAAAAAAPATNVAELRQEARRAAESGDTERLRRLADEILAAESAAPAKAEEPEQRAAATLAVPAEISQPFPGDAVARARALGLGPAETRPSSPEVARALAEFQEEHAWRTSSRSAEQAREGAVRVRESLERASLPAELLDTAAEAVALFALHPFVNSGGVRYLFHFANEHVLIEDFPESDDPPAEGPLLAALGLGSRRGLARVAIERALRERAASVVRDLGLDPIAYRLLCIPYDVYVRAGRDLGWGKLARWTHVDGYQLVRGGRLRALVAGDVRYGGLLDLCAISPEDQREGVVARFAVVRRARLSIGRG